MGIWDRLGPGDGQPRGYLPRAGRRVVDEVVEVGQGRSLAGNFRNSV
jgi:hypothetical protein